jgi:hypothetical protein
MYRIFFQKNRGLFCSLIFLISSLSSFGVELPVAVSVFEGGNELTSKQCHFGLSSQESEPLPFLAPSSQVDVVFYRSDYPSVGYDSNMAKDFRRGDSELEHWTLKVILDDSIASVNLAFDASAYAQYGELTLSGAGSGEAVDIAKDFTSQKLSLAAGTYQVTFKRIHFTVQANELTAGVGAQNVTVDFMIPVNNEPLNTTSFSAEISFDSEVFELVSSVAELGQGVSFSSNAVTSLNGVATVELSDPSLGIPAGYNGKFFSLTFNVRKSATAGETTMGLSPIVSGVSDSVGTFFTPNYLERTLNVVELLVANPDSVTVSEDCAFTPLNLLENDQIFSEVVNPSARESLEIVGMSSTASQWSLSTIPTEQGGTVRYENGEISYQPKPDFCGEDSFYYQVQMDSVGNGQVGDLVTSYAKVTVTVTAENDKPILATLADLTVNEDATIVPLVLSASDVDGDTILFSASSSDSQLVTVEVHGNRLSIILVADAHGEAEISVEASDQTLADSKSFHLTVNPVNDGAPVISPISSVVLSEDDSSVFKELVASDVDGDPVVFSANSSVPSLVSVAVTGTQLTITPLPNQHGLASITVEASDSFGAKTTATFSVTVNAKNDVPVAMADSYSVAPNGVLTVSSAYGVLINDSDVDDSELSAFLVSSTSHGQVELGLDGSLVYTPSEDFVGIDTFTYWAYDGELFSEVVQVTVAVNNGTKTPLELELEALGVENVRVENLDRYQDEFDKYESLLESNPHFCQQIVDAVNADFEILLQTVEAGWNMISSPYVGWSPLTMTGSRCHRPVFLFDSVSQVYRPYDSSQELFVGDGYWIHVQPDEVGADGKLYYLVIGALPTTTRSSIENGWNLVGPLKEGEWWRKENLVYTWLTSKEYYTPKQENRLEVGKGYWVFVWPFDGTSR